MDKTKVDAFISSKAKFFPTEKIEEIRSKLSQADDSAYDKVSAVDLKDPTVMQIISIFLGEYGVDQFMLGNTGRGVLKLLTAGVCGVFWIIDFVSIQKKVRDRNFDEIVKVL